MKSAITFLILVQFLISCKSDYSEEQLRQFLNHQKLKTQIFTISPDTISVLEGEKGTILKINPENLKFYDGSSAKGEIQVELIELITKEDLLRGNAQTISNEKWLISGGAFNILLSSDGKELFIEKGKTIEVNFPKNSNFKMELFYGNRDFNGSLNWQLEDITFSDKKYPIRIKNDTSFLRYNRFFGIDMGIDSVIYYTPKVKYTLNEVKEKYQNLDTIVLRNDTILGFIFNPNSKYIQIESEVKGMVNVNRADPLWSNENWAGTEKILDNLYEAVSMSKLGWVNVDRFYPQINERVDVTINYNLELDFDLTYVIDDDNNTVIELYPNEVGKLVLNAPVSQSFYIVSFGIKNKEIYGLKKRIVVDREKEINFDYKKINQNTVNQYFQINSFL